MSNSKLARKLRVKLQLRDKKGRWIEMGRGAKWLDFNGKSVSGVVIGSKGNVAVLRQKNADGSLSGSNVNVHMNQLEMINEKASLDPATIELVKQYKDGQSSKDQKETEAREKALAEAKSAPEKAANLAEVEYEVSLEEELAEAYDRAPVGSALLNSSDKVVFTKTDDGKWTSELSSQKYSSAEMASDNEIAENHYVTTGDETEDEISQLFEKITEEYNDPDDTKASLPEGADPEESEETEQPEAAETPAFTLQDLKKAPVGAKLEHKDGLVLTKQTDGKWESDGGMPFTSEALLHAGKPGDFKADFMGDSSAKPAIQVSKDAPIDISDWKYHQGTQGGSNPGGIYTAPDGKQYYVKHSKSDMHAKNEVLADKFYEALGVKTSQLKIADVGNGKLGTASEMVEGSKSDFYSKTKTDKEYLKKFQDNFAIDAWLANWDVVGLEFDNALTDANGDPTRIDPGGALLYRAMGSPKGDMFGEEVGEWESMRNGSNPASKVFGSMTDDQLKASVAKLNNISDSDIDAIVDSMEFDQETSDYLKGTLKARKENLLAKYPELATESVEPQEVQKDFPTKKQELMEAAQNGEIIDPSVLNTSDFVLDPNEEIYVEWEDIDDIPAYKNLIDGFTESEMLALKDYVKSSDSMNWFLRGNKYGYTSLTQDEANDLAVNIPALDGLIAKSVLKEDTSVFRGIAMSTSRFNKFMESKMYKDNGFSSTSTDKTLAEGWAAVDPDYQPDKTEVSLEIALPKGFTAHRVNYDVSGTQYYQNEKEVILPRGTEFDIVGVEEYTGTGGKTAYRLKVEPILTEENYKPEEVSNGEGTSEDGSNASTGDNLEGSSSDSGDISGEPATGTPLGEDGSDGGSDDSADTGGSTAEEGSEQGSEGVEDSTVTPAAEETETVPATEAEDTIAPINGAKVMQQSAADKEGLSLEAWKEKYNVPSDGVFPNKNKVVTNENGDEFVANAVVSNPKFGQGIASIILPSTNSVKVLYMDHGYKVTQAKNLTLVGDGPAVTTSSNDALDLSGAKPGDVGTNPVDGKMYFVGKDGNALYIGDEVEYTKKGVTQTGKVSSIYKGAQTVKVTWDEGAPSVKKASQISKTESEQSSTDAPETTPQVDTTEAPETPEASEAPESASNESEAPATTPEPEASPEPAPEAAATENKGWTPEDLGTYDPMGPTTVQIYPDLKTAKVYAHDHSGNQKQDYALKGTTGYNPVEQKHFGVGHNLQPLYVGDQVDYLWLGEKFEGKIVDIAVTSKTAKVELADGTIKLKKFSQLRGNYPKTVDVDENGNYTDWHGNPANIPTLKKDDSSSEESSSESENTSSEETVSDAVADEIMETAAPTAPKPFYEDLTKLPVGSSVSVDGKSYYKVSYSTWISEGKTASTSIVSNQIDNADTVSVRDPEKFNLDYDRLSDLGVGAVIKSDKFGLTMEKDSDGDWYLQGVGYLGSKEDLQKHAGADDWTIVEKGEDLPTYTADQIEDYPVGSTVDLDGETFYKLGDGWYDTYGSYNTSVEMAEKFSKEGNNLSVEQSDSNITEEDLDEMKTGASLTSDKLGVTLEKDSDGDWSVDKFSLGYLSNGQEVLSQLVTDDWVIDSTGNIDPNLSYYDLDAAPDYSELYSPEHGMTWTKENDTWSDTSSGIEYGIEEILSEYADENFTLTESEIDSSYTHGLLDSDANDMHIGSTIAHTDSALEEPISYKKIGEDLWAELDYSGDIKDGSAYGYSNSDFEEGYYTVTYYATEDEEITTPELLEYESNHADFGAGELTVEWAENAPVGTMFKTSMSSKWTYIKKEDGLFYPLDEYGKEKGNSGSPEQLVKGNETTSLVNVFVPENESEDAPVYVSDMENGSTLSVNDTLSFTKDEEGNWKMTINGEQQDTVVPEALVQEVHDKHSLEVIKPATPEPEVTPEATPEAEETPAPAVTEAVTEFPEDLSDFNLELLASVPVGTHVTSPYSEGWKKIGDNSWISVGVPDSAPFGDESFSGYFGVVDNANKVVLPETNSPSVPENMSDLDTESFKALPVGAYITAPSGTPLWEKDTDGYWKPYGTKSHSGFPEGTFNGYFNDAGSGYKINYPVTNETTTPVSLKDLSPEDITNAPIGSVITSSNNDSLKITKVAEDKWTTDDNFDFSGSDFTFFAGKVSPYSLEKGNGSVTTEDDSESPATESSVPTDMPLSDAGIDTLENAPVGTELDLKEGEFTFVKKKDGDWHPMIGWSPYSNNEVMTYLKGQGYYIKYKSSPSEDNTASGPTPSPASEQPISNFTLAEIEALPAGSKLSAGDSGATFTKDADGKWVNDKVPSSKNASAVFDPATMSDYLKSVWKVTPAGSTPQPSGEGSGVTKGVKISDQDLDAYPVGTTLKKENPAYFDKPQSSYFVKQQDGSWQEYSKTAHTLQTKENYLPSQIKNWYGTFTASVPSSGDHFVSGLGEIGYVGDPVAVDGQIGEVLKIMKTGIKVKLHDGTKVTVKPAKVTKGDPTFGLKPKEGASSASPQTPVAPVDTTPSKEFAGANAEDFNAQGIVTASNPNPNLIPSLTLAPSHQPDPNDPLYGTPKPEEPATPSAYPHFEPPQLELPQWDSAEWLKKVEQRYLDNPNKAKATVQESNKWSSIENVLKGEKQNLDNLLSSKYLDDDLYAEAVAGINKQSELNAPLIEEHKQTVANAKIEYEAKKTAHLADYTKLKTQYDADYAAWMAANPDPNAMKLPKMPETSKENFTGESADWTKAHIGTYSAQTAFDAVKSDNAIGRHGLSVATDSEKIENLDVNISKIIGVDGNEALDLRFKVTVDHGKTLDKFFKNLDSVNKSNTIFPPKMNAHSSGLLKEQTGYSNTDSGTRYEYTHPETGAKVIFQRGGVDKEFNPSTLHNTVRIVMPAQADTAQYQQVLDHLGINAKPATEGDIRVLAENRLVTLFGSGKTAIGSKNLGGAAREQALKEIETKYGIKPEDLVFENEVNGRVRMHFTPEVTKKLADRFSKIKSFRHNVSNGSDVDIWMNIIAGPTPGLASTFHRWSHGVNANGMSSSSDMSLGSGDYIYTTPSNQLSVGGNSVGIHPEAIFRRGDLWANTSDNYGKKNSDGYDIGAFEKFDKFSTGLHEVLPQDTVSINDFQFISVGDAHTRKTLIEKLKAKGILKINGFNIEDFIVTYGMKPPQSDYIPGYGVVPVGTILPEAGGDAPAVDGGGPAI